MTTPLGATAPSAVAVASGSAPKAADDSGLGKDAFMKLLVAQLKYQNPMAPADGQSYMTQMATFAQVEKLDALVKAQTEAATWQQRVSAEGLVGRAVSGTTDGVTTSGTVTGVTFSPDGPVLELAGGKKITSSSVDHVTAPTTAPATATAPAPAAGTAPAAAAPSTSAAPVADSTAAPAAGTPSA